MPFYHHYHVYSADHRKGRLHNVLSRSIFFKDCFQPRIFNQSCNAAIFEIKTTHQRSERILEMANVGEKMLNDAIEKQVEWAD